MYDANINKYLIFLFSLPDKFSESKEDLLESGRRKFYPRAARIVFSPTPQPRGSRATGRGYHRLSDNESAGYHQMKSVANRVPSFRSRKGYSGMPTHVCAFPVSKPVRHRG